MFQDFAAFDVQRLLVVQQRTDNRGKSRRGTGCSIQLPSQIVDPEIARGSMPKLASFSPLKATPSATARFFCRETARCNQ